MEKLIKKVGMLAAVISMLASAGMVAEASYSKDNCVQTWDLLDIYNDTEFGYTQEDYQANKVYYYNGLTIMGSNYAGIDDEGIGLREGGYIAFTPSVDGKLSIVDAGIRKSGRWFSKVYFGTDTENGTQLSTDATGYQTFTETLTAGTTYYIYNTSGSATTTIPKLVFTPEVNAASEYSYETDAALENPEAKGYTVELAVAEGCSVDSFAWYLSNDSGATYNVLASEKMTTVTGGTVNLGLVIYDFNENVISAMDGGTFAVGAAVN